MIAFGIEELYGVKNRLPILGFKRSFCRLHPRSKPKNNPPVPSLPERRNLEIEVFFERKRDGK
jgi:hypothetical protein